MRSYCWYSFNNKIHYSIKISINNKSINSNLDQNDTENAKGWFLSIYLDTFDVYNKRGYDLFPLGLTGMPPAHWIMKYILKQTVEIMINEVDSLTDWLPKCSEKHSRQYP